MDISPWLATSITLFVSQFINLDKLHEFSREKAVIVFEYYAEVKILTRLLKKMNTIIDGITF